MSLVINHNMMADNTARNLNSHYSALGKSMQRLSSGLRVNSAADDAAGLAIRELQRADITTLHQGARNANDAISMIQTADGALGIIDEKLTRMKELAEQAATGTYDSTQRYYYITIGCTTASALGIGNQAYDTATNTLRAGGTVSTQQAAQQSLEAITKAIVSKDKIRAHLGAVQNRLENTITNLNTQAENLQAAESRISDVDVATEMTSFVRNQILTQSAVAMLSQANSLPQMAMKLIGG